MALRHIVTLKLSGESREERDAQAAELSGALLPLVDAVPTVRAMNVHRNELFDGGNNWDYILIVDFDDADGLAVYAPHPEHLKAVEVVKRVSTSRAAIDFSL